MSEDGSDRLLLEWIPGRYAVCRLGPDAPVPEWILNGGGALVSITRTDRELSIVAPEGVVPEGAEAERGWVALRIAGVLDFGLVGILARLTSALADAGVPVFCISTFETDVLLVRTDDAERAAEALRATGCVVKSRAG